ncbi:hypothetical protein [Sphingomonas sp. Leaf37]|uniref:hypothetical protein n=1 Tax=Sphingomonas sp. Leaf37 TaxID=2876552 RepID=UPI001E2F2BC1|nr:hypothetical protein [Sphingomonas sp. Leaf37]
MIRAVILAVLPLAPCSAAAAVPPSTVPSALDRDLAAYAVASCFAAMPQPHLKEQGERWAGAVIQRGHGSPEQWSPVADAVAAELKRAGIAQGQGDGPQAPTVPLPVMTCGEITHAATVRAAIAIARRALTVDYKHP